MASPLGASESCKHTVETAPTTAVVLQRTHLLGNINANLVQDLFEDLVSFLLLVLEVIVHDIIDGVGHHLFLHVHSRALSFKLHHDALYLGKVKALVHSTHCLCVRSMR